MNKDYAVVEFLYETVDNQPLVQEVPVKWLEDGNTMCWWPPRNPYREIKLATDPDKTLWRKHSVRVKKFYTNLMEARQKCLEPSDFEEEEIGNLRRKKTELSKHCYRDSSHSPPPQPPSHATNYFYDVDAGSESSAYDFPDYINAMPTSGPPSTSSASQFARSAIRSKPSNLSNNEFDEVSLNLKALTDEIVSMRKQLSQLVLRVSDMSDILNEKNREKPRDTQRLKDMFPIRDENSLKKIGETLDGEPRLVDDLMVYLKGIGGSGPKDHHSRMLKSLISNGLGIKCSWKGQRGNIKLEDQTIMKACINVMKQTWQTTEKEFEVFSQDWLRHCSQRKKREEERNRMMND